MMDYLQRLTEEESKDPAKVREKVNDIINQLNLLTRIWEGCHNGVSRGITDTARKEEAEREVSESGKP